jgi:hypothetical protein
MSRPSPLPPAAPSRRPPFLVRLFTSPVTAGAVERRIQRSLRPLVRRALIAAPFLFAATVVALGAVLWARRPPALVPRHRAEALCYALAANPRFAPPMAVDASAAMIPMSLRPGAPPAMALRLAMRFDDAQVLRESPRRVGDYDVDVVWLHLPERGEARQWLVVGWMEDAGLAVCSFAFDGAEPDLSADQELWGDRLLQRILRPEYFTAGSLPHVRLTAAQRDAPLRFGPHAAD